MQIFRNKHLTYSMAQTNITNPFQSPPHTVQTPPQSSYESLLSSNTTDQQQPRPQFFINTDPNQPDFACSLPQAYFMQPVQPMDQFNTYPNFYANSQQIPEFSAESSSSNLGYMNNNFTGAGQRISKSFSTPCHQTMSWNNNPNGNNGNQF